jgi:hypothetical protein
MLILKITILSILKPLMYEFPDHSSHSAGNSLRTSAGQAKEETPRERLEEILQAVSTATIIGFSIRYALNQGTGGDFGKLISELKDHLRDTPGELEKVIGSEGIDLLKVFS